LEPLYAFGFGLSYTSFVIDQELSVKLRGMPLTPVPSQWQGIAPGGSTDLWTIVAVATVSITNKGARADSAVPQLYASLPQDTTPPGTPVKVLRGFEKVHLLPGETQIVSFDLMREISFWDVDRKIWIILAGSIRFMAGFNAKDLHAVA
jgi:beta-glucosidase